MFNVQVQGNSKTVEASPTVTASSAYTAGDTVGSIITLTDGVRKHVHTGFLHSIQVIDAGNQSAALEVLIFESNPSAATVTDHAAFVFSTDISKLVARVPVAAADYTTIDSIAIAEVSNIGRAVQSDASGILYAVIVTTGTPTYAATTDLTIRFGFLQD